MNSREPLLQHLAQTEQRYRQLEQQLAEQAGKAEPQTLQHLSKELASLKELVLLFRTYQRMEQEAHEAEQLVHAQGDAELRELAREEAVALRQQQADVLAQLDALWSQGQAAPDRPVIVEIRAATGGREAALFVGDLFRLYGKYAARCGLRVEPMESHPTEDGGFKEITFEVSGAGAFEQFRFESGVHRVQRVPATEAQGRIHTSTVTVAVLPEPEEVELPPIPSKDLQIDVFRSSGPGGQSVNTTDSAVRIRHLPSGIVVTCQDERSQMRNKEKAMRVLRARVLDQLQRSQQAKIASDRREQVKGGERSEKIRTYNYPDQRVTDHRLGLTLHKFDAILNGELHGFVDALASAEQAKRLQQTPS